MWDSFSNNYFKTSCLNKPNLKIVYRWNSLEFVIKEPKTIAVAFVCMLTNAMFLLAKCQFVNYFHILKQKKKNPRI